MKQLAYSLAAAAALFGAGSAAAADGAALYQQNCVGCHQPQGAGAPGVAPPLGASLAVRGGSEKGRSYLTQVLVHVHDAVFLNVAPIFNDHFSPIATNSGARANVNIFSDHHITGNAGLRVYKS